MRELVFIQAAPDDFYYLWQTHAWLESLKKLGKSDKAISCIFTPNYKEPNKQWESLVKLYPESKFFFYKDTDKITNLLGVYIPILRPYILMKYWMANPDMKDKAVFYCDNDVLFTNSFNVDNFVDDDICYLSNTNSYINAAYFDSKGKAYEIDDPKGTYKKGDPIFVLKDKYEEYKTHDILDDITRSVGISREIAEKNNTNSGGAQYLLKNIDSEFWNKVITDILKIRIGLQNVNKQYFESENKGFQSWCADMWSVLWNLWLRKLETKVVIEMDFSWSSDAAFRIKQTGIFHNAGIVSELQGEVPVFYKGKYHNGLNPLTDPHLEFLSTNEQNKTLANHYYVTKLMELKAEYGVQY